MRKHIALRLVPADRWPLHVFVDRWSASLDGDKHMVGPNWSGAAVAGFGDGSISTATALDA